MTNTERNYALSFVRYFRDVPSIEKKKLKTEKLKTY